MSSPFIRFDPETVELLDRCISRVQTLAMDMDPQAGDALMKTRFASALIEAASLGEREEERLVDFALQVLPAYREGRFRASMKRG